MKPRILALIAAALASGCTIASKAPATPVGRVSRSYVDDVRLRWDGAGPRPLAVLVWYPADAQAIEADWFIGEPADPLFRLGRSAVGAPPAASDVRVPLIVLSHGTGGSAPMLAWLGEDLARAGYIVAAVNHHGNTSAEPSPAPEGFMLWWERATDISRVLDRLIEDPHFGPRIDPARIGAAGFSLGGYTVLAIAGARTSLEQWTAFCESAPQHPTCTAPPEFPEAITEFARIRGRPNVRESLSRHGDSLRDPRVLGVFVIAPVGTWLTEASLRAIDVPVQIVVGTHDAIAPAATNAERLARLIPSATVSLLDGVGHYTFLAECASAGRRARPDLCHEEPEIERGEAHRSVSAAAVAFFENLFAIQ